MVAVGDDPGGETVVGQLIPEVVGVPGQHRVGAVAEMGAVARSGVDGGRDVAVPPPWWPRETTTPSDARRSTKEMAPGSSGAIVT
jgi:hypothetical protein